ncbi:MAG: hypothetical protein IPH10_09930 [bacterium]|nr:hypothetical protein [bacterium]
MRCVRFRQNRAGQAESILETAIEVAGSDLRASLVTFRDERVLHPLTRQPVGRRLTANGGLELPEASAVALREIISGDGECVVGSGFTTPFRNGATRLVILITDAPNGGCDDLETPDDIEYAHQCALDAANEDIAISAVYVADGDFEGPIIEQMRDYAYTTGGLYVESGNGDNFAAVLSGIISMCGQQNLVLTGGGGRRLIFCVVANSDEPGERRGGGAGEWTTLRARAHNWRLWASVRNAAGCGSHGGWHARTAVDLQIPWAAGVSRFVQLHA